MPSYEDLLAQAISKRITRVLGDFLSLYLLISIVLSGDILRIIRGPFWASRLLTAIFWTLCVIFGSRMILARGTSKKLISSLSSYTMSVLTLARVLRSNSLPVFPAFILPLFVKFSLEKGDKTVLSYFEIVSERILSALLAIFLIHQLLLFRLVPRWLGLLNFLKLQLFSVALFLALQYMLVLLEKNLACTIRTKKKEVGFTLISGLNSQNAFIREQAIREFLELDDFESIFEEIKDTNVASRQLVEAGAKILETRHKQLQDLCREVTEFAQRRTPFT